MPVCGHPIWLFVVVLLFFNSDSIASDRKV